MKKRLLLAFLLLVCFWHFNVNAETLTNGAVPEEVAQESFNDNDKEKTVEEKKTDNSANKKEVVSSNPGAPPDQNVSSNKKSDVSDDANALNEQKSEEKNIKKSNDSATNDSVNNNLNSSSEGDSNNLSSNTGENDLVGENKPAESLSTNGNNSNDGVLELNGNNNNQEVNSNQQPVYDSGLLNTNQNGEAGNLQDNPVTENPSENLPSSEKEKEEIIPLVGENPSNGNDSTQLNNSKSNTESQEEPKKSGTVENTRSLSGAKNGDSGDDTSEENPTEFGIHFAGSDPVKLSELINRFKIQFADGETITNLSLVSNSGKMTMSQDANNILDSTITRLEKFEVTDGDYDILTIQTSAGITYTVKMDGKEPNHSKELTYNTTIENGEEVNDGTYKISLTFTGEQEYKINSANVILVLDTSNSMEYNYTYGPNGEKIYLENSSYYDIYDPSETHTGDWNTDTIYGIVDYKYVPLTLDGGVYKYNGTEYTGTFFAERTGKLRYYSEFKAVNDMGLTLLSQNSQMPGKIQIAVVDFNEHAIIATENNNPIIFDSYESTNGKKGYVDFVRTANGFEFAQWTNWEDALKKAASLVSCFGDDDPTFIIFVSDGEPTAYYDVNKGKIVTGRSSVDKNHAYKSYDAARIQARSLVDSGVQLFSIGAYGTLSSMEDLVNYAYNGYDDYNYDVNGEQHNTAYDASYNILKNEANGKYYEATNEDDIQAAFSSISSLILSGIRNTYVNDGTTSKVTLTSNSKEGLLDVDTSSFEYFLSWEVTETGSNQYTFNLYNVYNNVNEYRTYNVTVNGSTVTITDTVTNKTSTYEGTVTTKDGKKILRVKWDNTTKDFYYIAPSAQFVDGDVQWPLNGLGTLLDKVTYEVTFDVWPSQTTYDLIADLENGVVEYNPFPSEYVIKVITKNESDEEVVTYKRVVNNTETEITESDILSTDTVFIVENDKYYKTVKTDGEYEKVKEIVPPQAIKYLLKDSNNKYTLITNTEGDAYVSFDDTRSFGYIGKSTYKVPEPVGTDVTEMIAVTKVWDIVGENKYPRVQFNVSKDGELSYSMVYNSNTQKYEVYISVGVITDHGGDDIQMKTSGHNYGFVETGSDAYHWELISNTVRPMLINNHLTMLVLMDENDTQTPDYTIVEITDSTGNVDYKIFKGKNTTYSSNDTTKVYYYYVDAEGNNNSASCSSGECVIINQLRSNLDIVKTVYSRNDDSKLLNNKEFTFKITVTSVPSLNPDDEYIWFSVADTTTDSWDPIEITTSADVEIKDGNPTYYYYVASGTEFTVQMKSGYSLRIRNILSGSTYSVEEILSSTDSYDLDIVPGTGIIVTGNDANATIDGNNISGIIPSTQTDYRIDFKNYELIDVKVVKNWDDVDDIEGKRSDVEALVYLYKVVADTTTKLTTELIKVGEDQNWSYEWNGLPTLELVGDVLKEVTYYVVETLQSANGYTHDSNEDVTEYIKVTATNDAYTTGYYITTITNHYVPLTEATVLKVWKDGENAGNTRPESLTVTLSDGTEVTLNEDNGWTATVENLTKYDENKELIVYTWTEGELPEGYRLIDTSLNGKVTTLTNRLETEATVLKVWKDGENKGNTRPESLTVTLSDGTEVTLNEDNGWTATVTMLPVYDDSNNEIEYTWTEGELPEGYRLIDTSINGLITTLTNRLETEATVIKVWKDGENKGNTRPESLTVTLSDGTEVTLNEDNEWTATVTMLPVYDDSNNEIEYTWTEGELPEGYRLIDTSLNGKVTTLTNRLETEATVIKVWKDGENKGNTRPESLTVTLSDGTEVTLNEDNEWTATVTMLPVYDDSNNKIEYTWTEGELPEGYRLIDTSLNGKVTTLTNRLETEATVLKVWKDGENKGNTRPESLTVTLSDGTEVTLNEDNEWTATVTMLPVYDDSNNEIEYTWTEGELPEGYRLIDTSLNGKVTTLTNRLETEATVIKVWIDGENAGNTRPESLTVTLSDGTEVTLNEDNEWTATVTMLPVYDDSNNEIEYTWTEGELPEGYRLIDTSINGLITTLTNRLETEATVIKVWKDGENKGNTRPESLTVTLSDGTEVTLNEDNEWTATVTMLPVYDDSNNEIEYTWTEGELPEGYRLIDTSLNGKVTTLTNRLETEATVIKVWIDGENAGNTRPESLTVTLSDGTEVTLNEDNEWTATVTMLPVYDDSNNEIEYTWTEGELPEGYRLIDTSVDGKVTTLTNRLERVVTVLKVWADDNNESGKRPANITITLLANDESYDDVVLSEGNEWKHEFTELPVYDDDNEKIIYSVVEENVPEGYEVAYEGDMETGFIIHNVKGKGGDNPQTGDNIVLYLIALLISIIGLVKGKLYLKETVKD